MKYKPKWKVILGLVILLVASFGGLLAWNLRKSPAVPSDEASSLEHHMRGQEAQFRVSKTLREASGKRPDVQKESHAMMERMLTEFPALKVEKHPVPAEQNALLMLAELSAFINKMAPPLSEEFRNFLSGSEPWDAATAKRFLKQYAVLVSMVEKIAALETRSSEGLPSNYDRLGSARAGKIGCDILLLKARLAAESGDEPAVLRVISAASNFGNHFLKVDSPTMFSATSQMMQDMAMKKVAMQSLLPALGRNADLSLWKSAIAAASCSPTELAKLLRGSWNAHAEQDAFPDLVIAQADGKITDAQAAARAYSDINNMWVAKLPTLSLAQIESYNPQVETSHLSSKGRELVNEMVGLKPWLRCYVGAAVANSQHQAVIDLLMLEKSGVKLGAADAARITHDPMTGQPFIFDPAKRELLPPPNSASTGVGPIALPW